MVSNDGDTIELVVHSPKAVAKQHKQRAGISFEQLADARCDIVGRHKSSGGLWATAFKSKSGSWLSSDSIGEETDTTGPGQGESRHTSTPSLFSEVITVDNLSLSSGSSSSSMRRAESDNVSLSSGSSSSSMRRAESDEEWEG